MKLSLNVACALALATLGLAVPSAGVAQAGSLAPVARATSGQLPLAFSTVYLERQAPVEQQTPGWLLPCPIDEPNCAYDRALWVVNPSGCPWDADDSLTRSSNGYGSITAGSTVTDEICAIEDQTEAESPTWRYASIKLYSSSPNLTVKITINPGETVTAALPTWRKDQRVYEYYLCVNMPGYWRFQNSPLWQQIPGSNGGEGVPTTVTLTLANYGTRDATKTAGSWGIWQYNQGHDPNCQT
jgi:hypothetical protein